MKPKKRIRRPNRSKILHENFTDFVHAVCNCNGTIGVQFYEPTHSSGEALLYAPVCNPESANVAFDPYSGRWLRCEMLAEQYICFSLNYSGAKRSFHPVPEGGEELNCFLSADTPASVAEVLEVCHDAKGNLRNAVELSKTSLSSLFEGVYALVWRNYEPRLMPLHDASSLSRVPTVVQQNLSAHLADDFDRLMKLGGEHWWSVCRRHTRDLAQAAYVSPDRNDLIWNETEIRAFDEHKLTRVPRGFSLDVFPEIVLRPKQEKLSTMFATEFFGCVSQGARALSQCLRRWSTLPDLMRNLDQTRVAIPRTRMMQVSYAIELRATRYALEEKLEQLIRKPRPLRRAIADTRARLRETQKLLRHKSSRK